MTRCDDCFDDPCSCDWDDGPEVDLAGDDEFGPPLTPLRAPPLPSPVRPFAEAVASLRLQYQHDVVAVAAWCLERGFPCDRDTVALCLKGLEWDRQGDDYELDRPDVMSAIRHAMNEASMLHTLAPDNVPEALWAVVSWLYEGGRLGDAPPPLPVLLEPLRCYGGLDENGAPRPSGIDIDFGCQCYIRYDPSLPAGFGQHAFGWDPDTCRQLLAEGPLHPRGQPTTAEDREPLLLHAIQSGTPIAGFVYAGRVAASRGGPELWIYHQAERQTDGPAELILGAAGDRWRPLVDRRYRRGFRWVRMKTYPVYVPPAPWEDADPTWDWADSP